jgi:hypothetical protein
MKRQKLELSLTQFWSEEFRNELAASVRRPIRQPTDPPTRSSLPPSTPTRRPADPPTRSSLPPTPTRRYANPPTRSSLPQRRPADTPIRLRLAA